MRYTKKVSMWPVGLITKYGVSSPIVRNGSISGFYDGWIGGRKFPVDMAGFAVNVNFLLSRPNASMPYKPGYEEDGFLKSLSPLNLTEIELMASNCTQVWKSFQANDVHHSRENSQTKNWWTDDKFNFSRFRSLNRFSYGTRSRRRIQTRWPSTWENITTRTCSNWSKFLCNMQNERWELF